MSPASLHAYLFVSCDPANRFDPTGNFDVGEVLFNISVRVTIIAMNNAPLFTALGYASAALNMGLLIGNEDYRNAFISSVGGPGFASQMLTQEVAMLFEFGGLAARAVFVPARTSQARELVLDLFGGETSQIAGAINVDLRATSGIKADVGNLPFASESADKIVASGPRASFLDEASRVLKPGGKLYINFTTRNKFGKLPDESTLQALRLRPIIVEGPLDSQFANQTFALEDGSVIPTESVRTTILEKY